MALTPIIIGVGDCINRSVRVEDALEPLDLILAALRNAFDDASGTGADQLIQQVNSLEVVLPWTWPYPDLPALLAERLGITKNVASVFSPTTRELGGDLGGTHSIGAPIQVYPLYENGYRAAKGQSIEENAEESAKLYADFAKIAAGNPMAWTYGQLPVSENDIKTISKKNRMICSPCKYNTACKRLELNQVDPLLMNAFNNVNLAGACIITSTKMAENLKVSPKKWIYPLGGAGTRDAYSCKLPSGA
jgi:hypothetical protein